MNSVNSKFYSFIETNSLFCICLFILAIKKFRRLSNLFFIYCLVTLSVRVNKDSLVRHFALHFPSNSGGIVCQVAELNGALCPKPERNFISSSGKSNVPPVAFIVTRLCAPIVYLSNSEKFPLI